MGPVVKQIHLLPDHLVIYHAFIKFFFFNCRLTGLIAHVEKSNPDDFKMKIMTMVEFMT